MSMIQKYAEAIYSAQADRDKKVLAIIAKVLGVESSVEVVMKHRHRLSKHRHADRAETFLVDGAVVAFATFPTCSQDMKDGLVTITATYHLSDETLPK